MTKEVEMNTLFTRLRDSEPALNEDQFLHSLNLALPPKRGISMALESAITLVASVIGCSLVYHYFPAAELLNQIPRQFTVTPQVIASLGGAAAAISGLIYWTSEADLDF